MCVVLFRWGRTGKRPIVVRGRWGFGTTMMRRENANMPKCLDNASRITFHKTHDAQDLTRDVFATDGTLLCDFFRSGCSLSEIDRKTPFRGQLSVMRFPLAISPKFRLFRQTRNVILHFAVNSPRYGSIMHASFSFISKDIKNETVRRLPAF